MEKISHNVKILQFRPMLNKKPLKHLNL